MAAKYNVYAVARGINKETGEPVTNMLFNTWDEAKPYVVNVNNARYKSFLSAEEANLWLAQVATESLVAPKAKTQVVNNEINIICQELDMTRKQLDEYLEKKFIEEYKFIKGKSIKI